MPEGSFGALSLALESRFPEMETGFAETRVEHGITEQKGQAPAAAGAIQRGGLIQPRSRGVRVEKAPQRGGASSGTPHARFQARESSDNPMLNAFCRVAPSVRFRVRAMLVTRVFFSKRLQRANLFCCPRAALRFFRHPIISSSKRMLFVAVYS
jgi:hypothetical protein